MPITVTTTPAPIKLSSAGKKRWNEIIAKKNVEQMKAGFDNTGSPLPDGVDLYQSGDLQSKISVDEDGYTFDVGYAEEVDNRFHYQGLSEGALAEIEPELEAVGDSEFYIEETEV